MTEEIVREEQERLEEEEQKKEEEVLEEGPEELSQEEEEREGEEKGEATEVPMEALLEERKEKELYKDRLLRFQADFDNYKRRVIKEREKTVEQANRNLMEGLLPIIDNLERAISSKPEDELFVGVAMILRQLMEHLKTEGLEEIEALGKIFDPCYHEAVERVETEDCEEETIVQVLQKGYCFKGEVIRAAVVKVAG